MLQKNINGMITPFKGKTGYKMFQNLKLTLPSSTWNLIKNTLDAEIKLKGRNSFVARDIVYGDWQTANNGKFIPMQIIYNEMKNKNFTNGITNPIKLSSKSSREAGLMVGYFIREVLNDALAIYECGACEKFVGYRYIKL